MVSLSWAGSTLSLHSQCHSPSKFAGWILSPVKSLGGLTFVLSIRRRQGQTAGKYREVPVGAMPPGGIRDAWAFDAIRGSATALAARFPRAIRRMVGQAYASITPYPDPWG